MAEETAKETDKRYRQSLAKLVFVAIILLTLANFLLNISNLHKFPIVLGIVANAIATLYLNLAIIKSGYEEKPNLDNLL